MKIVTRLKKDKASVISKHCLLIGDLFGGKVAEYKRSPEVVFPTTGFKDFELLFGRIKRKG